MLRPDQQTTEDELLAFVNGKLASYKNLCVVEFIDAIPKIPSGKILRCELKERERRRRERERIVALSLQALSALPYPLLAG